MPNLGDIDRQSIAGAIATATHGTGLGLGNLATTVVGMELVTGTRRRRPRRRPDRRRAAARRAGRARRPRHRHRGHAAVRAGVRPARPRDGRAARRRARRPARRRPRRSTTSSSTGCPAAAGAARSSATSAPTSRAGRSRALGYVRDKWIGENLGFGLVCRVGRRFPRATPTIAKLVSGAAAERDVVDRSDRVFCTPRRVHFVEMEYGLPVEHLADAVRTLRDGDAAAADADPVPDRGPGLGGRRHPAVDRLRPPVGLDRRPPVPRRAVRGVLRRSSSGSWTSTAAGRTGASCTASGRRRWPARYPQWDDFQAARDKLDPDRTFANPYLDRVLGP